LFLRVSGQIDGNVLIEINDTSMIQEEKLP